MMLNPLEKQPGPNLGLLDVQNVAGRRVKHHCGGDLVQLLWRKRGIPPMSARFTPDNIPGTIFCIKCGFRAGRRVTRLLKQGEGDEDHFNTPRRARLISGAFVHNHNPGSGKALHSVFRFWHWKSRKENERGEFPNDVGVDFSPTFRVREAPADYPASAKKVARKVRVVSGTVSGRYTSDALPVDYDPFADSRMIKADRKYILRYKREEALGLNLGFIVLNREYWSTALARELRDLLPNSKFASLADMGAKMRSQCDMMQLPNGPESFVVTATYQEAREFEFPVEPVEVTIPEDVPF